MKFTDFFDEYYYSGTQEQETERQKNSRSGKALKRSTPWWNASLSNTV